MAAPHAGNPVSPDTLITIKISVNNSLKKLKLPLRDLGVNVLPDKLRHVLDVKPEQRMTLERYSDSAGGYITLEENNPQVFKTLVRAAKAKLKLRLKATITPVQFPVKSQETDVNMDKEPASKVLESTPAPRDSTAFDQRSIGSGIFQFKEARASQQTLVNDEAPVPRSFIATRSSVIAPTATAHSDLAFRPRESIISIASPTASAWSVYCNDCDKAMNNEHYHCSICDGGDYDLCQECINSGKLCPGEGHWLIKRFIQGGKVVNSTTERISPRKVQSLPAIVKAEPTIEKEMPGTFMEEIKISAEDARAPTRTCNCCVIVLPEREFVTCTNCEDFDLCIKCHTAEKHGHHPAHGFKPATSDTVLPLAAETKLAPGRNVRHNAICDGCDKKIYGVRHKCLNCPDWDYCGDCIKDARQTHPRHRFAPLYNPIADQGPSMIRHFGIYCDGPLCSRKTDQSYIHGVRYKCTICHDTDFCASCEASPNNHHNRTHPLIKLKTPVRNVSVETENEDVRGNVRVLGDMKTHSSSRCNATLPNQQANVATQVQTVAEFTPTEIRKEEIQPTPAVIEKKSDAVPSTQLNAHFVRDSIPDGMIITPEQLFTQVWTMKNPGPHTWPAGCSVRYVGGDNMLNVDNSHPASVTSIADATESNVVGREVHVGEEVAFKVVLKAPVREGKSISYWRLKAADGTPFGHRLWCDVEVQIAKQTAPAFAAASLPPQISSYQQQQQIPTPQLAAHRLRIQQMQAARQAAHQKNLERMTMAPQNAPQSLTAPIDRSLAQGQSQAEQPPAYDSANLSARLAAMREHQKQRRDAMIAQLNAQREQQQAAFMPSWPQQINRSGDSAIENERREALKQRVAHIKANIWKTRQERERLAEEFMKQKTVSVPATSNSYSEDDKAEVVEKMEKIVAQVMNQTDDDCDEVNEELEGSQMVFPKLDRESPASSTYQSATSTSSKGKAAYVENEEGEIERSASPSETPLPVPATPVEEDFVDLDDELEVLSANEDESDEDDGFLTDEEYDILDASDNETVTSK